MPRRLLDGPTTVFESISITGMRRSLPGYVTPVFEPTYSLESSPVPGPVEHLPNSFRRTAWPTRREKGNIGHATFISYSGRVDVPGDVRRLCLQSVWCPLPEQCWRGFPSATAGRRIEWAGRCCKLSLLHDARPPRFPGNASAEHRPVRFLPRHESKST